jgi:hypothetical protein
MYTSTRSKRIVIDIMRSHEESSSVSAIAQRQELPVIYTRNLLIPLVKKARGGFKCIPPVVRVDTNREAAC